MLDLKKIFFWLCFMISSQLRRNYPYRRDTRLRLYCYSQNVQSGQIIFYFSKTNPLSRPLSAKKINDLSTYSKFQYCLQTVAPGPQLFDGDQNKLLGTYEYLQSLPKNNAKHWAKNFTVHQTLRCLGRLDFEDGILGLWSQQKSMIYA